MPIRRRYPGSVTSSRYVKQRADPHEVPDELSTTGPLQKTDPPALSSKGRVSAAAFGMNAANRRAGSSSRIVRTTHLLGEWRRAPAAAAWVGSLSPRSEELRRAGDSNPQ